jgi:hypothetical protein
MTALKDADNSWHRISGPATSHVQPAAPAALTGDVKASIVYGVIEFGAIAFIV